MVYPRKTFDCMCNLFRMRRAIISSSITIDISRVNCLKNSFLRRWKGPRGSGCAGQAIAELTILTASRCLMGKEIREQLSEKVRSSDSLSLGLWKTAGRCSCSIGCGPVLWLGQGIHAAQLSLPILALAVLLESRPCSHSNAWTFHGNHEKTSREQRDGQ